jgi:two-component system nitrate/nitrite response regulator NarL
MAIAASVCEPQGLPSAPVPGAVVPVKDVRTGVITVVVADHHALFREALREILGSQPDFQVVGEAKDGREAVEMARALRPSVVLLNLHMPAIGGHNALLALSQLQPPVHTLIVASQASEDEVVEALQLGARGIVMKQSSTALLFKSIRMVMAGQFWVERECVGGLIQKMQQRGVPTRFDGRDPFFGLTSRELELVAAVVEGCTNGDIASQLKISAKTVKHHLTKIFTKVGVSNRLELALFAVQHQFKESRFN